MFLMDKKINYIEIQHTWIALGGFVLDSFGIVQQQFSLPMEERNTFNGLPILPGGPPRWGQTRGGEGGPRVKRKSS